MTIIENSVVISRPAGEIYSFLADLNNHQQLMPENIYNWSSSKDEARFTIQNMAKLALRIDSRVENQHIVIKPLEEPPFELELKWQLKDLQNGSTEASLIITADLNMMMKMLAAGPLQKLVDHQTSTLHKTLS